MFFSSPWTRRQFLRSGSLALAGLGFPRLIQGQAPEGPPLPALRAPDRLDGPPLVSARAWAIAEGRTGRFLWGANEAMPLPMASTTKVMTAWRVLRLAAVNPAVLDEMVTFSAEAARTPGSSARLRAGDRLRVSNLLYGLLLPSGNDAATALAKHFGPRIGPPFRSSFVAEMNQEARRLGLKETSYLDPHGLGLNRTSARDLATLAFHAMGESRFRAIVGTRQHSCIVIDGTGARRSVLWQNTNLLLGIEGFDGVKTGTTSAAGSCLVASGRRGKDHLIVVVLGCTSNDSRYLDTRNLFRWGWLQRGRGA